MENRWLVLAGEWGGQIYFSCPVELIPGLVVLPVEGPMEQPNDGKWRDVATMMIRCEVSPPCVFQITGLPRGVRTLHRAFDRCSWRQARRYPDSLLARVVAGQLWEGVYGGMGGGLLIDGVWLHKEFHHPTWYTCTDELLGIA